MNRIALVAAVVFIFCGILLSQQAKTIDLTGKGLLDMMNSDKSGDKAYARGYIAGVYCGSRNIMSVPDDTTMKKIEESAMKYLRENPKKLSQPAIQLLKEAWSKAPPAEKK
jgi:hypothetical protein